MKLEVNAEKLKKLIEAYLYAMQKLDWDCDTGCMAYERCEEAREKCGGVRNFFCCDKILEELISDDNT